MDTNVLSEPLRSRPDTAVLFWLGHVNEDLALTSITVGEILTGVRLLPPGHRRDGLMSAIEQTLALYREQVLPYDEHAARTYAALQESRRAAGHPLSVEDGMIAAICQTRGATLAMRNIKDFQGLGIDLIDPWTTPGR
nr:type II toxin-antitoxin system VapC family toxin [Cryobacterium roopkundense]